MTLKISTEMTKRGSKVELSSLKKDEGSMPVDKKEEDEEERRTKWKLISMEIWWPCAADAQRDCKNVGSESVAVNIFAATRELPVYLFCNF